MAEPRQALRPGDPYCGECGYVLVGLTDASRCPECGTPFVAGLVRGRGNARGRRYTSEARVFGVPVVSVAFGPNGEETFGVARGFIALGDEATGFVAFGSKASGVLAVGGSARGIVALGGVSFGVISGGGAAIGLIAGGGASIGGVANGGAALGAVANGGAAIGYYARGGGAIGRYVIGPGRTDSEASAMFTRLEPITGATFRVPNVVLLQAVSAMVLCVVALVVVALAFRRHERRTGRPA